MKPSRRTLLAGAAAAGLADIISGGVLPDGAGAAAAPAPGRRLPLQMATDDVSSPFYAVGVSMSALVKMRVPPEAGVDLYTMTSLGSWQNATLLRRGLADFALMESLFAHWARRGTGVFRKAGPDPSLMAVTGLWPSVEHVLIPSHLVVSGTIADLRNLEGAAVSLGPRGSSTEATSHLILARSGVDTRKAVTVTNGTAAEGALGLIMGTTSGMMLGGGPPVLTVNAVLSRDPAAVRILEFTDRQLRQVDRDLGMFIRHVIPPGTYSGQHEPISSIAQRTLLAVRADVDADTVYAITRALMENLQILANGHPATAYVTVAGAVNNLPVPLHPGAARYFSEIGLNVAAK